MELAALGVDLSKVKVQKAPEFNGVRLTFPWSYHGEEPKVRTVTWVQAHVEKPDAYPVGLKSLLETKTIDFYFQKAANHVPKKYGEFLPQIAQGIKEGGYMLTSDYDMFGKKHTPDVHFKSGSIFFKQPLTNQMIDAYKQLFVGTLPKEWYCAFEGKLEDRVIPPMEEYYLFVDIRKKYIPPQK